MAFWQTCQPSRRTHWPLHSSYNSYLSTLTVGKREETEAKHVTRSALPQAIAVWLNGDFCGQIRTVYGPYLGLSTPIDTTWQLLVAYRHVVDGRRRWHQPVCLVLETIAFFHSSLLLTDHTNQHPSKRCYGIIAGLRNEEQISKTHSISPCYVIFRPEILDCMSFGNWL